MSAWAFTALATTLYACLGILGGFGVARASAGVVDLVRILGLVVFFGSLWLLTRRRQYDSWQSGIQMTVIVFGGAWLAIAALRLLEPVTFATINGLGAGFGFTVIFSPLFAAVFALGIWVGRKFSPRLSVQGADAPRSNEELKPMASQSSLVAVVHTQRHGLTPAR